MKKEALFWDADNNQNVRCRLCPHGCLIAHQKSGKCKVRYNEKGILYTRAYQNLCALAIDPIEKKPLYHFLPGSKTLSLAIAGCNLTCKNCQNAHISQETDVDGYPFSPQQIVELCLEKQCPSISFTYSEPTIYYEYMLETARLAKNNGIRTIIVSNGYINQEPLNALIPFLDAANIDVKAFSEKTYRILTGGSLLPVLDTIKTLIYHNIHVELTYLIVPTYSDDFDQIDKFLTWLSDNSYHHIPLHFSRFFPRYQLSDLYPTPVEHIKKAMDMARLKGIRHVYAGNVAL